MKYIKNYKVFENNTDLTQEQIDFLNRCDGGEWKVNPDTGLIDVQGSLSCSHMNLNDFKGLRFGNVLGTFYCEYNNLKTLDGSPREVGGSFGCRMNPLISLEGAPLKVAWQFGHNDFLIKYNLTAFLDEIKKNRPGVPELLLTHHFLTPQVIKQKIQEDDKYKDDLFCRLVGRAWNREGFENKREILENPSDPNGLSPETLQKIKDFSAIRGYL